MVEHLLPTPKVSEIYEGTIPFNPVVTTDCPEWKEQLDVLKTALEKIHDCAVTYGDGGIRLVKNPALEKGAYTYDVDEEVVIAASDTEGICYGIATALQCIVYIRRQGGVRVQRAHIEDKGDKEYRAVMLDLVPWHTLRQVLRFMDVCFYFKIPFVHLHLIDNTACRIPSKAFPKITAKKHYSYEDIKVIRDYAKARGLTLIPEYEVPGHARQLGTHYPEVFSNVLDGDPGEEKSEIGASIIIEDVVCAGSEKCMNGIKTMLDEMMELFPDSPYIHIGGDEAFIKVWNYCPACRAYMKDHNIEDEYEMYSDFVGRVAQYVLDCGRTPIVWEGFPKKGAWRVPKDTIVIAWESLYNLAPDLLKDGFKIINGSWQPLYIAGHRRWTTENILDWNVYNWQHWFEKSPAMLNPISIEPTDKVWGAQFSLWTTSYEQAICPFAENASAFIERTWNLERTLTKDQFYKKMSKTMANLWEMLREE